MRVGLREAQPAREQFVPIIEQGHAGLQNRGGRLGQWPWCLGGFPQDRRGEFLGVDEAQGVGACGHGLRVPFLSLGSAGEEEGFEVAGHGRDRDSGA